MKKFIYVLITTALLATVVSCSKKETEEIISITGTYRYDGNEEKVLDAKDYYDFVITENSMTVKGMFAQPEDEPMMFSYTRKVNKITITPALGGKVSNATIVETSDGFGMKVDENTSLYFTKRSFK